VVVHKQAAATTALIPLGLPYYQKAIIVAKKTYEHHGLDKYNLVYRGTSIERTAYENTKTDKD
jgi:hypothetical protein